MKRLLLVLLCLCGIGGDARAQAAAQGSAAAPAAPAKSSTIIPGTPLAALTGANAAKPASETPVPAPFGTEAIGFSLTEIVGADATKDMGDFAAALRKSMQPGPLLVWLKGFAHSHLRQQRLVGISLALLCTVAPALLVQLLVDLALLRPRRALVRRAAQAAAGRIAAIDGIAAAEAGAIEAPPPPSAFAVFLRRIPLSLAALGLALLPLLAFLAAALALMMAGTAVPRPEHLAVVGTVNIYLATRVFLVLCGFAFAPRSENLRLVPMPDARARSIMRWLDAILATILIGYMLTSTAQLLWLPREGRDMLVRLVGLAVHLEVALGIWRSRHAVAGWIAGPPEATGAWAGFRRRLARVWHIPALFYVLALWLALAGGVRNAFVVLLRIVLVIAGAAIFGRLAWSGSERLLERSFPALRATDTDRGVYARARAYNPLARLLVRFVVSLLVLLLALQALGIAAFHWLVNDPFSRSLIHAFVAIVITIVIALVLWEVANALLNRQIDRYALAGRTQQARRLRTLLPMLKGSIGFVLALVAGLICLSKIGVNAAPLLAGAGVVGIAVGFGSQKLVQDVITGLFLLLEDAMQVGDVVSLAGMTGTVEALSIRTIRLRGGDGSVNIIPFSSVTTVTNMTRDFSYAQISIPVAYDEDLPRVQAVLADIAHAMREETVWGAMIKDDLQIFGLDQFGVSALTIMGQIRTGPGQHWAVRREFYARVKARFEAEGIEIPYTYLPPAPPRPDQPLPDHASAGRAALQQPRPGAEDQKS